MTRAPYPSPRFTALATAHRVTVIPVAGDELIAVLCGTGHLPGCRLPTGVKVHPRARPETAARLLLTRDLSGCEIAELRLVAILDPLPGRDREAVYVADVSWPGPQPAWAGCGRHRLLPITTRDQAARLGLQPARVTALLTGDDLCTAARALPELGALDGPGALAEPFPHIRQQEDRRSP